MTKNIWNAGINQYSVPVDSSGTCGILFDKNNSIVLSNSEQDADFKVITVCKMFIMYVFIG